MSLSVLFFVRFLLLMNPITVVLFLFYCYGKFLQFLCLFCEHVHSLLDDVYLLAVLVQLYEELQ